MRNITGYRNVFNLDPFATNFDFDSLLKCCQIRNYKSMKHTDDSLAGRHVFSPPSSFYTKVLKIELRNGFIGRKKWSVCNRKIAWKKILEVLNLSEKRLPLLELYKMVFLNFLKGIVSLIEKI